MQARWAATRPAGRLRTWLSVAAAAFALVASSAHAALDVPPSLRFTEIMYNPFDNAAYEFVELKNTGIIPVDLSEMSFSGITFTFPAGSSVAPGGLLVLISDANPRAFTNRYPTVPIAGIYSGRLSNDGERIALADRNGRTIVSVEYNDSGFWSKLADGNGSSLEVIDPERDIRDPANWRASDVIGGTPGTIIAAIPPTLRINEVRAAPVTDTDWVELVNAGDTTLDLTGWTMTDERSDVRKFIFPEGTLIGAGGYLLVQCDGLTNAAGLHTSFQLDSDGEAVFLFDVRGVKVDGVTFGHQPADYSLGRIGNDWTLTLPTPTGANFAATLGQQDQLIINEWLANSTVDDWVELHNRDVARPVSLKGLYIATATAVFQIRSQIFVPAGGFLGLRADEQPGVEHLEFKLPAGGSYIEIYDNTRRLIDRVDYGTHSEDLSQGRLPDGAAQIVFFPSTSSFGRSNVVSDDGDGMPNYWEIKYGLDPNSNLDAGQDPDGDGRTNLEEFLTRTDPKDPDSVLKLSVAPGDPLGVQIDFEPAPLRSYSVLFRPQLGASTWSVMASLVSESTNRILFTDNPGQNSVRFYQVTTPRIAQPGEAEIDFALPRAGSQLITSSPIGVYFREGVMPGDINATNLKVVDDLGRVVQGQFRFANDFAAVTFEPRIPLTHQTTYTVTVADGIRSFTGRSMRSGASWTFEVGPSLDIVERREVYAQDTLEVPEIRITTKPLPGGYTWEDVQSDIDPNDDFEPRLDVIFQEGAFAAGVTNANASIQERGQTSRFSRQKSYRVELANRAGQWRGFETINLNKHPYDLSRMRNKLGFDLIKSMQHMVSLRTLFTLVFVDNSSTNDFGLFTHVENPDRQYLRAHGLDPNGHLYKAKFFEFYRYEDELRLKSDPLYDELLFEEFLEIKGSSNHEKLLTMLDDLNNWQIPINSVIEKHFNRNNYVTWLAANIVMGNNDTASQNFFLYSPSGSSTWYLLPWDYDGAFDYYGQPQQLESPSLGRWQRSLANWWGGVLHNRFLREPGNLDELNARVAALATGFFTRSRVDALIDSYLPVIEPYATRNPDLRRLPIVSGQEPKQAFRDEVARLKTTPNYNYTNYFGTLDRPMPVFLGRAEAVSGGRLFVWDPSFDLQGDGLTYDFQISTTPDFQSIVFQQLQMTNTRITVAQPLASGTYYWRVIIRDTKDPQNNWQIPFDSYYDDANGKVYRGVSRFVVP